MFGAAAMWVFTSSRAIRRCTAESEDNNVFLPRISVKLSGKGTTSPYDQYHNSPTGHQQRLITTGLVALLYFFQNQPAVLVDAART